MNNLIHDIKCMAGKCSNTKTYMFKKVVNQRTKEATELPIHINICQECLPRFITNIYERFGSKDKFLPKLLSTKDHIMLNFEDVKKHLTSVKTEVKSKQLPLHKIIFEGVFSKELDIKRDAILKRDTYLENVRVLFKVYNRILKTNNKVYIEKFINQLEHFQNYYIVTEKEKENYEAYSGTKWAYNLLHSAEKKRSPNQKKDTLIARGYKLILSSPRFTEIFGVLEDNFSITIQGRKLVFNRAGVLNRYELFIKVLKRYSIHIAPSLKRGLDRKHKQFKLDSSRLSSQKDINKEAYIKEYKRLKELSYENSEQGFTMKLFDYQCEDIASSMGKRYLFNTGQMGVGKGIYGYMFATQHANGKSLIIMPANNLKDPWQDNAKIFCKDQKVLTIRKGREAYKIMSEDYDILLVPSSIVINDAVYHFLKKQNFAKFILDESHNQKSTLSIASKRIERIVKNIKYKYLLSGTPVKKDNNDLYPQFLILFGRGPMMVNMCEYNYTYDEYKGESKEKNPNKGEIFTKKSFSRAFSPASIAVFNTKKLVNAPNKEDLDILFKGIRIRRTSQEAFLAMSKSYGGDLLKTPLTIKKVDLNFTSSELIQYENLAAREFNELMRRFSWHENPKRMAKGQLCHYLRRVISHPWTYDGFQNKKEKDFMKIKWILKSIKQFVSEGKKVLIGTSHTETYKVLSDLIEEELFIDELEPQRVFKRDPSMSIDKRGKVVKDFKTCNGGAVLIGTIGTMNSGLNIPEVDEVIVESIPWDYATLMQFIFRAVRANAKVPTTAHLLAVNDTFDINLMAMVASKMKQTEFSSSGAVDIDDKILKSLDINAKYLEKTKTYDF